MKPSYLFSTLAVMASGAFSDELTGVMFTFKSGTSLPSSHTHDLLRQQALIKTGIHIPLVPETTPPFIKRRAT